MYRHLMVEFGFKVSNFDPCLFYMHDGKKLCLVGIHVDDSLLVFEEKEQSDKFIAFLQRKIKIKDLGPIKTALGMDFIVNQEGVTLSQRRYAEQVLLELGFDGCHPSVTPACIEAPVGNKMSERLSSHTPQDRGNVVVALSHD